MAFRGKVAQAADDVGSADWLGQRRRAERRRDRDHDGMPGPARGSSFSKTQNDESMLLLDESNYLNKVIRQLYVIVQNMPAEVYRCSYSFNRLIVRVCKC